jgi:ABC-type hemin transport system substrate-binding protein
MPVHAGAEDAATVLRAIVWPTVAVIVLRTFRGPVASLINRTNQFKAGPAGVEVSTVDLRVNELAGNVGRALGEPEGADRIATASDATLTTLQQETPSIGEPGWLSQLAASNPTQAVVFAWRQVRQKIKDLAAAVGSETSGNSLERLEKIQRVGKVDISNLIGPIQELRALFYYLKQEPGAAISPANAQAYVSTAQAILNALNTEISEIRSST